MRDTGSITDPTGRTGSTITIRTLDPGDAAAVARLAELDSKASPAGPLIGIETDGRLLAVMSLSEGTFVADPFSRTDELRGLLELRVGQLRDRRPRRLARLGTSAIRRRPEAVRPAELGVFPRVS